MTLTAWNTPGAKPGQRVVFIMYEASMIKAAFVTFVLPLITTILGVGAGYWIAGTMDSPLVWAGALTGIVVGVAYIRYFDCRLHAGKGSIPEIIRIIE